jgi:DEAD/DEAH box helicase domain-containing protein
VNGKPGYLLRIGKRFYTIEPQADLGPGDGVHFPSRPDFLIRAAQAKEHLKPVALFMDGYEYHKDRLADDTAKRLAIVQSDRFWQWALTWNDVIEQFAKSEMRSRNPFAEGLQPAMQPVQAKAAERLDVGHLTTVASLSPLEQLLRFLERPEPEAWAAMVFTRCLGWFDQENMRSQATRQAFEAWLSNSGSEGLKQLIEDLPGNRAYGGMGWSHDDDPLSVHWVLAFESLSTMNARLVAGSVVMDDMRLFDPDTHKAAWHGFLRLYNLLQFLPATGFFTQSGAAKGVYESIPWRLAEATFRSASDVEAQAPELEAVLSEAVEELHAGLTKLFEMGCLPPVVAFELQDAQEAIVGEAELAWPVQRLAGLLEHQASFAPVFESSAWAVILLDSGGQWTDKVQSILKEPTDG